MVDTRFQVASTVAEVVNHLAETEDSVLIAGGTSVVILLRQALINPANLVYLGEVEGLDGITETSDTISIGATTTLHDLARSAVLAETWPVVAAAAKRVGNPRVRAVATAGGAVAHADPRQDLLPALLAAGATVRVEGQRGSREVDLASGFFTGFMSTSLAPDELIVSIDLPRTQVRRSAYARFTPNSIEDFPTVAVAASIEVLDSTVAGLSVALGGVAETPILVDGLDELLGRCVDPSLADDVADWAIAAADPIDDRHGSAAYKRAMTRVWTRRVVAGLLNGQDAEKPTAHRRSPK